MADNLILLTKVEVEEHTLVEHFPKVRGSQIEGHDPIIRSGSADWTMTGQPRSRKRELCIGLVGRAAAGLKNERGPPARPRARDRLLHLHIRSREEIFPENMDEISSS